MELFDARRHMCNVFHLCLLVIVCMAVIGVLIGIQASGVEVPLSLSYSYDTDSKSQVARVLTRSLVSTGSLAQYFSFDPVPLNASLTLSFTLAALSPTGYSCFLSAGSASQQVCACVCVCVCGIYVQPLLQMRLCMSIWLLIVRM